MDNRYYQIGQVCSMTGLAHSTLRFWEKTFNELKPKRSSGGHRYYDSAQVKLILKIKSLLYDEGYTLEGAKKRIKLVEVEPDDILKNIKTELYSILDMLDK